MTLRRSFGFSPRKNKKIAAISPTYIYIFKCAHHPHKLQSTFLLTSFLFASHPKQFHHWFHIIPCFIAHLFHIPHINRYLQITPMDDCYISQLVEVHANVDYLDNDNRYNHNTLRLLRCHRVTRDARIRNVCWRRSLKNLHHLSEINPFEINWDKQLDITWLYGPEMPDTTTEQQTSVQQTSVPRILSYLSLPELELDCGLVLLLALLWASADDDGWRKLLLKRPDAPQQRKRVLFDYKVTQREIINGYTFDYQVLDVSL